MVSPEMLRRYPFFAGLSHDQIHQIAELSDELEIQADHVFYREGDAVERAYLLLDGAVAIFLEVPDKSLQQPVSGQLTGQMQTAQVTVSTVGPGEVFGWTALVPPPTATNGAKAMAPCRVVAFDGARLLEQFETDCRLGYQITQRMASVMRTRIRDLHIEALMLQQGGR